MADEIIDRLRHNNKREGGTRAAASRQTPKPLARIKAVRQTTGRPLTEWN